MVVIPEDRMIVSLPDGNFKVTPNWLRERYFYDDYLKEELKKLKKELEQFKKPLNQDPF